MSSTKKFIDDLFNNLKKDITKAFWLKQFSLCGKAPVYVFEWKYGYLSGVANIIFTEESKISEGSYMEIYSSKSIIFVQTYPQVYEMLQLLLAEFGIKYNT